MEYDVLDYRTIYGILVTNNTLKETKYEKLVKYEDIILKFVNLKKYDLYNYITFEDSTEYLESVVNLASIDGINKDLLTDDIINAFFSKNYGYSLAKSVYSIFAVLYPKQLFEKEYTSYLLSFDKILFDIKDCYLKEESMGINYQPFKELVDVVNECLFIYGTSILRDDLSIIMIAYAYIRHDYELLRRYFNNSERYIEKMLMNGFIVKTSEHRGLYFDYHAKRIFYSLDDIVIDNKVIIK